MFRTALLQSKKRALALSVHFLSPDLGMKEYEILSRASAFLLTVDPPNPEEPQGKYSYLDKAREERTLRLEKQDNKYDPAGGPRRRVQDLGWLEFAPGAHRPLVHCVAASHVLAPWKWKQYYPLEWLQSVKQEHCAYSLEVYNPETAESLAKFDLNPYVIHHPTDMDLAIIHLKQEEEALKQMQDLGVESLYLRNLDTNFEDGETFTFEGFEITDEKPILDLDTLDTQIFQKDKDNDNNNDHDKDNDTRVFVSYSTPGTLFAATTERLLAKTEAPLPEGLCGGPTMDKDGKVAGIIEGIVPKDHPDERLAGAASFIPSFRMREFVDYTERIILKEVLDADVFSRVVQLKTTGEISSPDMNPDHCQNEFDRRVEHLRQHHGKNTVDAILREVKSEQEEVMEIVSTEGGDLEDIIQRVRARRSEGEKERMESVLAEKYKERQKAAMASKQVTVKESRDDSMDEKDQRSNTVNNKDIADAEYEEVVPAKDETATKSA